jgi:hypothetical protein
MIISKCVKPTVRSNVRNALKEYNRRVYLFKSDNNDYLSLSVPFTGLFSAFVVSTSTTGINPVLLDGLLDGWKNSTETLTEPKFNKVNLYVEDLTSIVDETFDGLIIYALDNVWNIFDDGYGKHPEIYNEQEDSWVFGDKYPPLYLTYKWVFGDDTFTIDGDIVISRGI